MEQTVAALTTESAAWWSYPRLLLAQAYCAFGRAEEAAAIIAELRSRTGGHDAWLHPQLRIAEAWLAAAQGNVSGAIATAADAAELAHRSGQRAIEMLALHDAARFGDRTSLQHLIEVAGTVAGRFARAYAAYGAAVRDRDPWRYLRRAKSSSKLGRCCPPPTRRPKPPTCFAPATIRAKPPKPRQRPTALPTLAVGFRPRPWPWLRSRYR
jgi:hypothetical protein